MEAIGLILAGGSGDKLKELAENRAIGDLPVGGNYRAIDFTLSSMSHSGIKKIGVIAQYNAKSLREHLSSSKWWELGRKNGGLHVFSPYLSTHQHSWLYRGTADAMYQNLDFLMQSTEEYVIIASADQIYKCNFKKALKFHKEKDSDITILYRNMGEEEFYNFGSLKMNEEGRLIDYEEKPTELFTNHISMGIYIIRRVTLIQILQQLAQEEKFDFVNDVIIRFKRSLKIYGYEFSGFWKVIKSVKSYYDVNMSLLKKEVRDGLFFGEQSIYTKVIDVPPAKYNHEAVVKNSIVPGGCIIDGYVSNSILSRGVKIERNSTVVNCIIFEGSYVGNNCYLENVIIDQNCVITDGKRIINTDTTSIIPANMVV